MLGLYGGVRLEGLDLGFGLLRCRVVPYSRARKLEHHYPHALMAKYSIGDPSTVHPKSMFQLSGVHCM